jgi:hypothetical protein
LTYIKAWRAGDLPPFKAPDGSVTPRNLLINAVAEIGGQARQSQERGFATPRVEWRDRGRREW